MSSYSSPVEAAVFKKHDDVVKSTWSQLQWSGREQVRVKIGACGQLQVQLVAQSAIGWLATCLAKFLTRGAAKSIGKHVVELAPNTLAISSLKDSLSERQIALVSALQQTKLNKAFHALQNDVNAHIATLVKQLVSCKTDEKAQLTLHALLEQTVSIGTWLDERQATNAPVGELHEIVLQGQAQLQAIRGPIKSAGAAAAHEAAAISVAFQMLPETAPADPSAAPLAEDYVLQNGALRSLIADLKQITNSMPSADLPPDFMKVFTTSLHSLENVYAAAPLAERQSAENACVSMCLPPIQRYLDRRANQPVNQHDFLAHHHGKTWSALHLDAEKMKQPADAAHLPALCALVRRIAQQQLIELHLAAAASSATLAAAAVRPDGGGHTLAELRAKIAAWQLSHTTQEDKPKEIANLDAYCSAIALCLEELTARSQVQITSLKDTCGALPNAPSTRSLAATLMEHWMAAVAPDYTLCAFSELEQLDDTASQAAAHAKDMLGQLHNLATLELHCRQALQQTEAKAAALHRQRQLIAARQLYKALAEHPSLLTFSAAQLDTVDKLQALQVQLKAYTASLEKLCQSAQKPIPYLAQLKSLDETDPDKRLLRQAAVAEIHQKIQHCLAILDSEQNCLADFLAPAVSSSWKNSLAACFAEKKRSLNDLLAGQVTEQGWFLTRTKQLPLDALDDAQLCAYQQLVDAHLRSIGQAIEQETAYSQTLTAHAAYQDCVSRTQQRCQQWEAAGRLPATQKIAIAEALKRQQARLDAAIKALSSKATMLAFIATAKECQQNLERQCAAVEERSQ